MAWLQYSQSIAKLKLKPVNGDYLLCNVGGDSRGSARRPWCNGDNASPSKRGSFGFHPGATIIHTLIEPSRGDHHFGSINGGKLSAAEDSNFPRFIAEFRRIALLPPSSLTRNRPGMFISR